MDRSILQAIWPHLRPISQTRIAMTCKTFNQWTNSWPKKVPQLQELLNQQTLKDYKVESVQSRKRPDFMWKWSDQSVSVCIVFHQIEMRSDLGVPTEEPVLLLIGVKITYGSPKDASYSYVTLGKLIYHIYSLGERHGKKLRKLPKNASSLLYGKFYTILNKWKGSREYQRILFPYCLHITNPSCPKYPMYVYWDQKEKCYLCNNCHLLT